MSSMNAYKINTWEGFIDKRDTSSSLKVVLPSGSSASSLIGDLVFLSWVLFSFLLVLLTDCLMKFLWLRTVTEKNVN